MTKIHDIYTINKNRCIFLENCAYAEKIHAVQWELQKKRVKKSWKISLPSIFSFDDLFEDDVFEWISNLI